MYCSNCGTAGEEGRFCSKCGFQNKGTAEVVGKHVPYRNNVNKTVLTTSASGNLAAANEGSSTAGFVLSIIGAVFVSVPLICLPLSITGLVLSKKRLNQLGSQTSGRGLAQAGLIIGSIAAGLTTLFMLLAIPGAYEHNFG